MRNDAPGRCVPRPVRADSAKVCLSKKAALFAGMDGLARTGDRIRKALALSGFAMEQVERQAFGASRADSGQTSESPYKFLKCRGIFSH